MSDHIKSDIRPPEIEIEKEIDIELEKERELETGHPAPAAYGRYSNVFLSDTELAELTSGTARQMGVLY